MKKYLKMLGVLLFACIFSVTVVNAAGAEGYTQVQPNCVNNGLGGKTCTPRLIVVGSSIKISQIELQVRMSKLEIRSNPVTLSGGWYETQSRQFTANGYTDSRGVVYDVMKMIISNQKTTFDPGVYELGTFVTEQKAGVNLENCDLQFVLNPSYSFPYCEIRTENGTTKYYDKTGKVTTEDGYYVSCFKCNVDVDDDGNIVGYRGLDGKPIVGDNQSTAVQKYIAQCANESLACRWVVDPQTNRPIFYGKNEQVIEREIDFIDECYDNTCQALYTPTENKVFYFDRNDEFVSETDYFKSCFPCQYYNNTEETAPLSEETLYRPLYTGYIDANGNKTDELGYKKSCQKFSCEILSDGTHYDKDGNIVSEDEYLRSCFKCRKENGKFYDENGKETTEDNWKVMCEPHKCQYLGGKYFNDKGAIVTKAEYDKACTNPKTGDKETLRMYGYIFGGFALTAAIVLGSRKFAKVNKIK